MTGSSSIKQEFWKWLKCIQQTELLTQIPYVFVYVFAQSRSIPNVCDKINQPTNHINIILKKLNLFFHSTFLQLSYLFYQSFAMNQRQILNITSELSSVQLPSSVELNTPAASLCSLIMALMARSTTPDPY